LAELENTAPRIKSDFKPQHAELVEAQKRKRLRKERRIKRIITVILGYVVMAWMIYLIMVTARTTTKVYDPYDILGVSRVRWLFWSASAGTLQNIQF
jgi:Preprotein translocase subunit Sec63